MSTTQFKVDPRTYVPLDSISLLESSKNYTLVHLRNAAHLVSSRQIGYLHQQLSHMIRVHRRFVVRKDQVANVERTMATSGKKGWQLILKSGRTIPVSYSHNRDVEQHFMKSMNKDFTCR